jgi:hypothetical protein
VSVSVRIDMIVCGACVVKLRHGFRYFGIKSLAKPAHSLAGL